MASRLSSRITRTGHTTSFLSHVAIPKKPKSTSVGKPWPCDLHDILLWFAAATRTKQLTDFYSKVLQVALFFCSVIDVLQLKYNPAKVAEVDKLLKVIFAQECYCFRALTVLTCEQSYSIKDICKGLTREYAAMSFVQRKLVQIYKIYNISQK